MAELVEFYIANDTTLRNVARNLLVRRRKDDGIMSLSSRKRGILVDFEPMSHEEIERTIQFLLRQQAQFAADFEKLSVKTDRVADGLIGLTGIVGRAFERVAQVTEEERQRTEQQFREHERQWRQGDARLREYIETVESHLNALIEMFDRRMREGDNRPPS